MTGLFSIQMSSSQPDLRLIDRLTWFQHCCIGTAFVIALVVLSGWMLPGVSQWLPSGWQQMKVTTAVCIYFAGISMLLSFPKNAARHLRQSRWIAALILLIAGLAFMDFLLGHDTGIADLIPVVNTQAQPGRMSIHTAVYMLLLATCLLLSQSRKNLLSVVADLATMALIIVTAIVLAGYSFNATGLFSETGGLRTSPQTLVCMLLLTFVHVGRRAESGFFSVLLGVGIGSRIARIALPVVLLLPFVLMTLVAQMVVRGWISAPLAAALVAIVSVIALFSLLVGMAWRINTLERDLRDMSLTDEMTQIYNRRGFDLFAGQVLREARRAGAELAVLFFDLDGLKATNDRLGHEAGSDFIREFAAALRGNFRDSDIIGRLGGDEFAVVTYGSRADIEAAERRLAEAVAAQNRQPGRAYQIRYSAGLACEKAGPETSVAGLLALADQRMYAQKQQHKAAARAAMDDRLTVGGGHPLPSV